VPEAIQDFDQRNFIIKSLMLRDLEEGTYGNEEIISAPDM
jgi:hypothetical protein